MFLTTFVKISEQEFELRVDNNVANPTAEWLTNQECQFQQVSYDNCTGFRILGIHKVVLQRLTAKFPLVAANDNSALVPSEERFKAHVDDLRKASDTGEWKAILSVTAGWTNSYKIDVWKALSPEERVHIEALKFKNSLTSLDKTQLRKMVTLLKEVTIIHKDLKLANKSEAELLDELFKLLPDKKCEVESALTLVKAMN